MSKICLLLLFSLASLRAQSYGDLLLPVARHIVGMVTDSEGNPVVGARVDHSDDRLHTYQTDAEGRFEMATRAPVLVIRKVGFRSVLIRTRDSGQVKISLAKVGPSAPFPVCKGDRHFGIDGWNASFRFPRIPGVASSKQGRDVDYGVRNYYVKTKAGPWGIRHGSGPMWGFGIPLDTDVWRSVSYEEFSYQFNNFTITDARGRLPNGNRWRDLGKFGESASYSDVDDEAARTLDKVLDGACWKQP